MPWDCVNITIGRFLLIVAILWLYVPQQIKCAVCSEALVESLQAEDRKNHCSDVT